MKPSEVLFPTTRGKFGMFDSVEVIRANDGPSYDEDMQNQYTGHMIDDLLARADNAIALAHDPMDDVLARASNPFAFLGQAQTHLADGMNVTAHTPDIPADVQAWNLLADLKEEILQAEIDALPCANTQMLYRMGL